MRTYSATGSSGGISAVGSGVLGIAGVEEGTGTSYSMSIVESVDATG
jgi:hypothetical protein